MKDMACFTYFFTIAIAMLVTATAYANDRNDNSDDYRPMIVFGDSLVDVGNLPPILFLSPSGNPGLVIPPPTRYDRGRFSNGPNIADYISFKLKTLLKPSNTGAGSFDSIAYGHGGATTYENNLTPGGFSVPGVLGQVSLFINATPDTQLDAQTLILINAGANDYLLGILQSPGVPPINPSVTVDNLRSAIDQLYVHGGRRFVVFNLPNLGKTPICFDFNICESLNALTIEHNALLANMLQDINTEFEDILIADVDFFSLFEKISKHSLRFGFTGSWQEKGPASGCLLQDPSTFNPINCGPIDTFDTKSIFWDEQHATTKAYRLIARGAWSRIKKKRLLTH